MKGICNAYIKLPNHFWLTLNIKSPNISDKSVCIRSIDAQNKYLIILKVVMFIAAHTVCSVCIELISVLVKLYNFYICIYAWINVSIKNVCGICFGEIPTHLCTYTYSRQSIFWVQDQIRPRYVIVNVLIRLVYLFKM